MWEANRGNLGSLSSWTLPAVIIVGSLCLACAPAQTTSPLEVTSPMNDVTSNTDAEQLKVATFANGCFWCTEAVFERLRGVENVTSGYIGGEVANPTYEQVCAGNTGHAEAIQMRYDPQQTGYEELLLVFWRTHDPTTLNRQGNDVGTQYRSAVFYHDESQRQLAEAYKGKLDSSGAFPKPIVTEITRATTFYPAEKYHQDYYNLNRNQPYCAFNITPKVEKIKKVFADKLKPE